MQARLDRVLRRDPTGGLGFCRATLDQIYADTLGGRRSCVIFDIDNTLVDTRARTRAAAHTFGRKAGVRALARLGLSRVGYDGRLTATKLGLGRLLTDAFDRHWNDYFWNPTNFHRDRPMRQTVQLARQAKRAGAEVFYLTGRIDELKPGTMHQLRRLGLPDVDAAHVICKPGLGVKTAPFKRATVERMLREDPGRRIRWFMSDSAADVAHVRGTGVACVWVDFPVKPPPKPACEVPAAAPVPTIRVRR